MAQRIPQEIIEEVRQRVNIVEVIEQYVQLKKSGKNYVGLCPFHEERSPSFSVAEDKQIFHCFGCGKGGTVFNFMQEIEGITFPEAVRKLAEIENLPLASKLAKNISHVTDQTSVNQQLIQLHSKAADLYHHVLMNTQVGEPALDYLLKRGLTKEVIQTFKLGFAPSKRDFLYQVFLNDQIKEDTFAKTGLFIQRENGSFLDRFYQRIIFPINDERGNIVAFSGRFFETVDFSSEGMPKYLNSPETNLFNKRDVLFNFDKARKDIRKESTVFLCEGFMDVLALWQSEIPNAVASMGTSLTNEQIRKIERISKEIVLCYDGDRAGLEATNRAISLLNDHSQLQLSIVCLPEKLDPDEYVRKYGSKMFKELALHGRSTVFSFKMAYLKLSRNMSNEKEQFDYVNELLQELVMVHSAVERDRYLNQISQEFQLSFQTLESQLNELEKEKRLEKRQMQLVDQTKKNKESVTNQGFDFTNFSTELKNKPALTKVEKAERVLLYRLMNEQITRNLIKQKSFCFAHDQYQELYLLLDSYLSIQDSFVLANFLDYLQDEKMKQLTLDISYQVISEESSERELLDIIKVIHNSSLEELILQKQKQKQEAQRLGNKSLVDELAIEVVCLLQQLQQTRTVT